MKKRGILKPPYINKIKIRGLFYLLFNGSYGKLKIKREGKTKI